MLHPIKITFLVFLTYSALLIGCGSNSEPVSLCDAIEANDKERILELLSSASELGHGNSCGYGLDPVSFALSLELFDTADFIIDNADAEMISRVDRNKWTPLAWASISGASSSVEKLIAKGASVDSEDVYGYTPLLWASRNGYVDIVKQLIAAGANINHQSSEGLTALMLSSMSNKPNVVKYLVTLDVDHGLRSKGFGTALEIAKSRGFSEVERILQSFD